MTAAGERGGGAPLVSVIIPAYNYAHFVGAAIESVRRQDYPAVEIILIDDGSTDDTPQVAGRFPGIRYVRQENRGLSAARNHGIALARGKFLQFLDADDLLGPGAIRQRVEYLEAHPACSAVVCRNLFFEEAAGATPGAGREAWPLPAAGCVDLALYHFNIAPPHAFLVRRATVEALGLAFDPRLRACEDYDFWFRLALHSGAPALLSSCHVYYRQHANSMSRSYLNQYRHDAELCRRIFAASRPGTTWIGHRPPADYLAAMFAAGVITARRLWQLDREAFAPFVAEHLQPLHQCLKEARRQAPATLPGLVYLARARLLLARMSVRDRSLAPGAVAALRDPSGSLFVQAMAAGMGADLSAALVLLKLDLQRAVLGFPGRFFRHG